MAMDDDVIKYSDIIQPDETLNRLIEQLEGITNSYGTMVDAIKTGSDKIANSLKSASGASKEGRKAIDEASEAATRLERAFQELTIAESETGKMIAQLKAQTSDANKASVAELRMLESKVGSYNRIQLELKEYVNLYKSLTAAERDDVAMGKEVIAQILEYKNQLKALDAQIKPHIETLNKVQKAEQELAFLRSEEGKRLMTLQAQIREIKKEYSGEKAAVDPLVAAKQKLADVTSAEYQELMALNAQIKEEQRVSKLTIQLNNAKKDTYDYLSAQYELGKIKLRQYTLEEIQTNEEAKDLVIQLEGLYAQMRLLQEATGKYSLGVGDYKTAFNGLSFSVSQVVRELPAAAINLSTFFLAISNNIPMVVDEINKLRKAGTSGANIFKQIGKAIFGWQTLLIAGLTVLSMYGDEIISWVGKAFKAKKATVDLEKVQRDIVKELENSSSEYGKNAVSLKKLTAEYKTLKTKGEKKQWIKDNTSEFNKLGIAVNDVTDAESAFVKNTAAVQEAFKQRARAAAASELAEKKYAEAFLKEEELKQTLSERSKKSFSFGSAVQSSILAGEGAGQYSPEELYASQTETIEKNKKEEIKLIYAEADAFYSQAEAANAAADAALKAAGIYFGKPGKTPRERKGRMVEDLLNTEQLKAQKNLNKALTDQEREEFKKRRDAAEDSYNEKVMAAKNANAKLKRILANEEDDYRDLTDEQKKQVEDTIATNERAIAEYKNVYLKTLDDIAKDEAIALTQGLITAQELRLKTLKEGSDEEFELRQQLLENQMKLALLQNAKLPASQQQDPALISAGYTKQSEANKATRFMEIFDDQQKLEQARFDAVEHSEYEITKFRLNQESHRWRWLITLAEQGGLDWTQAQIDAAKATVDGINNQLAKLEKDNSFIGRVAEHGLFGAVFYGLGKKAGMGESDIQTAIDGFSQYADSMIQNIQAILAAEIEYAETMKALADERVADAQKAYDAEVEARNNGYAHNVATAKKELEQEKRNQQQKQRLLEEAQRRQEALNSITQASSLITASAQLWQSFSSIPIVGPALAIAAIGTMWGSFTAAKIKARQVSAISEEYGEGGLEFLEGGSHASGNDIDLGVNNSRNRRMRAEGGEAMAIINKRNTRKYRGILPGVIDSLNRGNFEEKYLNAFNVIPDSYMLNMNSNADLTRLEAEVAKIRKQGEVQYFLGPDGTIIELKGNVKRVIKS